MKLMNQSKATIRLRDYMERDDGWGNAEGREVYQKLLKAVEGHPGKWIFRISLGGMRRTDASFPRESVVELAKRFRGQKGFCLVDVPNQDLMDNWEAAALKRAQPLTVWRDDQPEIIGPAPTRGNQRLLDFILSVHETAAVEAARALGLKLTNVSTKLKQLQDGGYILRRDESAPTGGVEYRYFRIG
jgi:hypothetical protein